MSALAQRRQARPHIRVQVVLLSEPFRLPRGGAALAFGGQIEAGPEVLEYLANPVRSYRHRIRGAGGPRRRTVLGLEQGDRSGPELLRPRYLGAVGLLAGSLRGQANAHARPFST